MSGNNFLMRDVMREERFDIISAADKAFIIAFDKEMQTLGYAVYNGDIGSGYCWGRYMIIYAKVGVKAKQVAARIYIREDGIILRLFFGKVDTHRAYIESAPAHIKQVFTQDHGNCHYCPGKEARCNFRKIYTLDDTQYEKCNGVVFEFGQPDMDKLSDYMGLLNEFYRRKTKAV